jgi:putative FmdB family regulatory protein
MPIYEYRCDKCKHSFEMIRRVSESDEGLQCPVCKGSKVNRLMSVFSSQSQGSSPTANASSCSPGPYT